MAFTPLGQPVVAQPKEKNWYEKTTDTLGNFSEGFVKSGVNTLQNIGNLVAKPVAGVIDKLSLPKGQAAKPVGFSEESLKPTNTAQQVGKTVENIAEFFIPASKVSKVENVITTLASGLPKFLGAVTRVGSKALVNAAADTAIGTAQTGDLKQGLEIGAFGGGTRAGLGVAGELARAGRLPERLYQTVFKNASRDMKAEFHTDAIVDLYKNRPHVFDDLVEQGIIKVDGGVPVLNTTMAEEALSKGLKGSISSMGKQVAGDLLQNESQARGLAKAYKGTVGLQEPQFFNILREISSEFRDVGFGQISKEADELAQAWLDGKGKVSGETGLAIRRFLDKARMARSFDVPATKLSMAQSNLKTLADEARGRLNQIPGMQSIMDDYSFNIDALEDLAKEASRRGNNQLLSLIDSIFLGGGLAQNAAPAGLTLLGLRKYIQSGRGATAVGSALKNPNASAKTVGAIGAGASLLEGGGQSQPLPQSSPQQRSFTPYTPKQ